MCDSNIDIDAILQDVTPVDNVSTNVWHSLNPSNKPMLRYEHI